MKTKIYILTLLALCMNVSLWAYDASNATIYYDNTASQWSKASILVGHDTWSTAYNMVAVSNTNLYYKNEPRYNDGQNESVIITVRLSDIEHIEIF